MFQKLFNYVTNVLIINFVLVTFDSCEGCLDANVFNFTYGINKRAFSEKKTKTKPERTTFLFSVRRFLQNNSLQYVSKHAFSGLYSLKKL